VEKKESRARLDKKNILFVTASTGYITNGLCKAGYTVMYPYNYKTIIGRIVLEIIVRLKLPQSIIFNKKILGFTGKYIIIHDTIITRRFLEWLKSKKPDVKIIYEYTNMIGQARNISPDQIPQGITVWTYDKYDSEKYNINLFSCGGYLNSYIREKREKRYDIMYVGKDKGRADYILNLKKQFEDMGLKTKFLIMPSTRISKKKSFYSKEISYEEVIKLVTESRAILNIALPNQKGATMRDFESIYNEVKLITTNENIKSFDFYDKTNVFIIGENDLNELPAFLKSPFSTVSQNILKKHSIDTFVEELISFEGK
jgi:hypothetical protein